ncbi:HlyC/CorC family transporter [Hydrocarboniphaga effusa]|uniref:HlyC/CorC family transporter n=3 Tax=Hydrocarboniphaga effusa TaxID=243629 RepID=UPI00398C03DD
MNDLPLAVLIAALLVCMLVSGFFSGSETGLMTLNRYRLRHRAQQGERGARMAQDLLRRPDRLIGLILLLNNVAQALIPMLLMAITLRATGDAETAIVVATAATALLIFVFSESMPKTLGALHPERIAIPAAYVYWPLLRVLGWFIDIVNIVGNRVLRMFGVTPEDAAQHSLSVEELRTVVAEAGAMIPQRHQKMLLSILDLEHSTVEDIMVPRQDVVGLDLSEPWALVRAQIIESEHTQLPVYHGSVDDLLGIVHLRRLMRLAAEDQLDQQTLQQFVREPYFVPEGTPLNQQLLNFQSQRQRMGFVVDEYGDIRGLVTLDDILEEVIGEFTTGNGQRARNVHAEADGSYRVGGSVTLRSLNRSLGWTLPLDGPKTVNGLVMERLEQIPQPGRQLDIDGYLFEITEVQANAIKNARITPGGASSVSPIDA